MAARIHVRLKLDLHVLVAHLPLGMNEWRTEVMGCTSLVMSAMMAIMLMVMAVTQYVL